MDGYRAQILNDLVGVLVTDRQGIVPYSLGIVGRGTFQPVGALGTGGSLLYQPQDAMPSCEGNVSKLGVIERRDG